MVRFDPHLLLTLALCALVLYRFCQCYDPRRLPGRMLSRCVAGALSLCAWNLFCPLHLGLNPLSALITGCLGLPGLGLLAVCALLV